MAVVQAKSVIDLSGLQWVRGELDQNLERVHHFIEAYLESPEDKLPLQRSVIELHQARGILAMVRLHGAALLAEELRQAVHDVLHGVSENAESIFEVVLGGAVQLSDYLDFVQSEATDSALIFQPLINELRVARGKPVVNESELFIRFLLLEPPEVTLPDLAGRDSQLASSEAKSFQLHFQTALLGVIKDNDSKANLLRLMQICQQVLKGLGETRIFQQWWYAQAVLEALVDRGLEVSLDVKRLLGKLGILLKYLAAEGQDSPHAFDQEVTYALLYYVGRSSSQGETVRAVRRASSLDQLLPDQAHLDSIRERLRGPNTSLLQTLSSEIRKDIGMVKDNLDLLLRAGDKAPDRLDETVNTIRRVATTLDMLGMTALQRVVSRQAEIVDKRRHEAMPDQREWLDAAISLLWVEHSLDELLFRHVHPDVREGEAPPEEPGSDSISPLELREGAASIVREALINIARIKELTSEFISRNNRETAGEIAHMLHEISAGLGVAGVDVDSVVSVQTLRQFVQNEAFLTLGGDPERVAQFADVVSSLELYLLALQSHQANTADLRARFNDFVGQLELPEAPAEAAEAPALASTPEPEPPPEARPGPPALSVVEKTTEVVAEERQETVEPEMLDMPDMGGDEPVAVPGPPAVAAEPEPAEPLGQTIDPEIREIFLEEVEEIREMLAERVPHWTQQVDDHEALGDIRRAFHTLKGSGRMAGATAIGDFGWAVEQMLNACLDGSLTLDHAVVSTIKGATENLPALVEAYSRSGAIPAGARQVLIDAHRITGTEPPASIAHATENEGDKEDDLWHIFSRDAEGHLKNLHDFVTAAGSELKPQLVSAEVVRAFHTLKSGARLVGAGTMSRLADVMETLCDAVRGTGRPMSSEHLSLIAEVTDFLADTLERQGQAAAAEPDPEGLIQKARAKLEELPEETSSSDRELLIIFTDEACDLLENMESVLEDWVDAPQDAHHPRLLSDICATLSESAKTAKVSALALIAQEMARLVEDWSEGHVSSAQISGLRKELAGVYDLLDLVRQGVMVTEAGEVMTRLHQLQEMGAADAPSAQGMAEKVEPAAAEKAAVPEAPASGVSISTGFTEPPASAPAAPEPPAPTEAQTPQTAEQPPVASFSEPGSVTPASSSPEPAATPAVTDLGDDLLALFVDEGEELLEGIGSTMDRWELHPEDPASLVELMRLLHTLKGSARMAGAARIGELSHTLEDELAELARIGKTADSSFFLQMRHTSDEIHQELVEIRGGRAPAPQEAAAETPQPAPASPEPVADIQVPQAPPATPESPPQVELEAPSEPEPEPAMQPSASISDAPVEQLIPEVPAALTPAQPEPAETAPGVEDDVPAGKAEESVAAAPVEPAPRDVARPAAETARVSVSQLDRMFNEAGEVGIYLGRMEKQQADLRSHLGEMGQAITRMREHIRQLDLEAESQLQARRNRQEQHGEDDRYEEDFDPLEMDRYTRMNELSRSLTESAADLVSLQSMIDEVSRSNETLLLQQGRITSNLQHGLMNTMLVPFAGMVQRLQRIVRQSSQVNGKQARLEFLGADNELDRNVLERMVGPLEHLLRNSVAHGIEPPEDRQRAGKDAQGLIRVSLRRDGTQSIIEVLDDGRGLDLEAIRRAAVKRHLIAEQAQLSEQELVQLIFEPGFSTADTITQEAGRGVGMDVVNAEIKQLGGSLNVSFSPGKGTQFLIRIPSSLALTQALLVRVGQESYAIGMAGIDGIERLPRHELSRYLAEGGPQVLYGGNGYQAIRMSDLIHAHMPEVEDDASRNVPVLLMRAGDMRLAVVVEQVMGGDELVVKSLGPQVSAIPGVSGGTILADGSVVLIMDVPTLYQTRHRRLASAVGVTVEEFKEVRDERPLVVIVDDSITIRRVTERFLSRHGYRIDTAKDGMDALPKLQAEKPDIVLLDVEMPRIDGFEVATYMRNNEHLQDVPIIMITSRSGDKHRQRAKEIGVDRYLIKPYQEDELLSSMEAVMRGRREGRT